MAHLFIFLLAGCAALLCPLLTLLDLPGNSLLLATALLLAWLLDGFPAALPQLGLLLAVYLAGELWEFLVSFFGLKAQGKLPWTGVLLIALGGYLGTGLGTLVLPLLGSFLGGLAGAFLGAYLYEYGASGRRAQARSLAWTAAKLRCLALLGKVAAALLLAILLVRLVLTI